MLEQCELKHAQLFFLIKVYEIYLRLNKFLPELYLKQKLNNIHEYLDFFEKLKKLYLKCGKQLDDENIGNNSIAQREMLLSLEKAIEQGLIKIDYLKELVCLGKFDININKKVKKLINKLKKISEFLLDAKSANTQSILDEKQKPFLEYLKKANQVFLQLILAESYSELFRMEEENFLLQKWQQELIGFREQTFAQSPNSYSRQISVEEMLVVRKFQFNQIFYAEADKHSSVIENNLLMSFDIKQDKNISDFLSLKNKELKQATNAIEYTLQAERYDVLWVAKLVSFFRSTSYYLYASSFFNLAEESTKRSFLQTIPIMREQLWPETIALFTGILAITIFSFDLYLAQYIGISYNLISSLANLLILESVKHQDFFDSIGEHRRAMHTEVLPALKWLLELSIYLLAQCLTATMSKQTIGLALGAYCIGILFQSICSRFTANMSNRFNLNTSTQHFLSLLNGYLTFGLGIQLWHTAIYNAGYFLRLGLTETNKDIIFNEHLCQTQLLSCCNQARAALAKQELDIGQTSNKLEFKSKLRYFLFGHHPDKTSDPHSHAVYHEVNAARQIIKTRCLQ